MEILRKTSFVDVKGNGSVREFSIRKYFFGATTMRLLKAILVSSLLTSHLTKAGPLMHNSYNCGPWNHRMMSLLDVTRLFTQMENMVKKEVQKQLESTDAVEELISDMKLQVLAEMQEQVEREVEKQVVARMREEVQREEVEVEVEVEEVQRELELQVLGRSGEQVGKYACPEMDIDFGGNDITVIMDVLNWEECGRHL